MLLIVSLSEKDSRDKLFVGFRKLTLRVTELRSRYTLEVSLTGKNSKSILFPIYTSGASSSKTGEKLPAGILKGCLFSESSSWFALGLTTFQDHNNYTMKI